MEQKSSPGEDSSFVLSSLGDPVKKRRLHFVMILCNPRNLSPAEKYAIFMEASRRDVPVGEVLRKWGIHSSEGKTSF